MCRAGSLLRLSKGGMLTKSKRTEILLWGFYVLPLWLFFFFKPWYFSWSCFWIPLWASTTYFIETLVWWRSECHALNFFFFFTAHSSFSLEMHLFLVSAHTQWGRVVETASAAVVLHKKSYCIHVGLSPVNSANLDLLRESLRVCLDCW